MCAHELADNAELAEPGSDLFAKGRAKTIGGHGAQRHLRVLELLHQLSRLAWLQQCSGQQSDGLSRTKRHNPF